MHVWTSAKDIPSSLSTVVTIGIFDGVHKGHRTVIDTVVRTAKQRGLTSVAVTFDPHPATIHRPDLHVELIMPLQDRLDALEALGLDDVWVIHYTHELSLLSPREFVEQYFVRALGARVVVVGEDVRFGRGNAGDISTLRQLGKEFDFEVVCIADLVDEQGERWSSTRVRKLLSYGDVRGAAQILGREYRLRGVVEHGFKRGRELGFPTANLSASGIGVVPADGVYAGWLVRDIPGTQAVEKLPSAISVGTNPQFDGKQTTVEAHVLGRADLNLYGQEVAVDFVDRIRPMQAFDNLDALLERMDQDLLDSATILGVPPAGRIDPDAVTAE